MNIRGVYTSHYLWLAAAILAAMPVWADGQLDTSFGANGIVQIAFPTPQGFYLHRIAVVNGAIEAVGYDDETVNCQFPNPPFPTFTIVRLSLAGVVLGPPHSFAQQAIQCLSDVVIDPATGDFFAISGNSVVWFDASGILIARYRITAVPPDEAHCNVGRALIDNQRRFVAACAVWGPNGDQMAALLRLSFDNGQLAGGLTHSFPWALSTLGWSENSMVLTQDPGSGAYYASATSKICKKRNFPPGIYCTDGDPQVARFDANTGTLDLNYGYQSIAQGPYAVSAITTDESGDVLIGGANGPGNNWKVARLHSQGGTDQTFGSNGIVEVGTNSTDMTSVSVDIHTDRSGRVYVLTPLSQLYRLNTDGSTDATFSSITNIEGLNGLSSDWISMEFADSSRSSAYLVGGAHACSSGCTATGAIIAKVVLVGNAGLSTTTTTLSSSATMISAGQTVTLTANVVGTNLTGTVTFKEGAATLGAASLSSGSAIYSSSRLAIGSHSITASYSGDSHNSPSTSTAVIETVNAAVAATTTALTSSATTIASGQAVNFAASVTGADPTGTVSFKDGSATLSSPVTVSGGAASYSTATLAVGSHSITASYSGDGKNAPSSSTATTVMVRAVSAESSGHGGGGSFTWADMCAGFLLILWRLRRMAEVCPRRMAVCPG